MARVQGRLDDLYVSLVGDLFEQFSLVPVEESDWIRLGNAFAQFASADSAGLAERIGVSRTEAALFSAASFYCGGYPASAYLTVQGIRPSNEDPEDYVACFDLLGRPAEFQSQLATSLLNALRAGDMAEVSRALATANRRVSEQLARGPGDWIAARLWAELLNRFAATNVRAVLPEGESRFWDPFVQALLSRQPPVWEYFPSQIEALQAGLLTEPISFTLQMPTGAGKTTLCETLLYWHARHQSENAAVLLVPFRSLAAELRAGMVQRLNRLGVAARCAYGGTVPATDEIRDLSKTQVLVATPEALSGLIGADAEFFNRVSLVICDEGHLLDSEGRGVSLELLLARFRSRVSGPPRFVFVSAIVPNVEEINSWLGGTDKSVIRSTYRPALAEFALLTPRGVGADRVIDLKMHPHEEDHISFTIEGFLRRADFTYRNEATGRSNTFNSGSIKTQAVATARKALPMGASVVFAANKRGSQGAIGIAEELLSQLALGLPLPKPIDFVEAESLQSTLQYLNAEFGSAWIGARMLAAGAVLHHGDIPQEAREVLEGALRTRRARFAVCTSTLAEGVNLPIRTLVLYSVRRQTPDGRPEDLLTRDIKNLVGRAGRAGATTKGLVICANPGQWELVQEVAMQAPGEAVYGALQDLITRLFAALRTQHLQLSNEVLERSPALYSLVDGIDATLVNLAAEEIGEEALAQVAMAIASETYASLRLSEDGKRVLRSVFELRARRIFSYQTAGRLQWFRETGARPRILNSVERDLLPRLDNWGDIDDPLDPTLQKILLDWAWSQDEVRRAVQDSFRLDENDEIEAVRVPFYRLVDAWLSGATYAAMAEASAQDIDSALSIHSHAITYALQTQLEQGVALLYRLLAEAGGDLSSAVQFFPDHLRFGVPSSLARILAAYGVTHRRASVLLSQEPAIMKVFDENPGGVVLASRNDLRTRSEVWINELGTLVYERTVADLARNP
jgi:hypothetical protein